MIFKELEPFSSQDKYQIAGRKAEEQMAHYLRRFFGGSTEVDVLNYLRIDLAGEVAQMDHLVLHPYGLLIVESKSVAGSVQIKDDGQWIRWYNKQPQGMRSPVTQAKMQVMLLKELLHRTVKQKGFFDQVHMDVLVAISDSGTIQWPASGPLIEVCKADQIPERIVGKLDKHWSDGKAPGALTAEHRRVIGDFLCKVHKPLARVQLAESMVPEPPMKPVAVSVSNAEPVGNPALPAKVCKHCGGRELEAQHGKFGYYFLCKSCSKNTGIKFSCLSCGGEGRVRKQGNEFFAECKACEASSLYHTNQ